MNKQDVLDGFTSLSPEDQAAVREQLGFDPMALCKSMMQKMQGSGDPMGFCKEMMQKNQEKPCCAAE